MRELVLRAVLGLILSILFGVSASGQINESEKALAAVKENYRSPLIQLVNDFVRIQKSQQWDQLYDIFSPTYIGHQSRDDYIKKHQSADALGMTMFILEFTLKRTLVNDPFDGQYSFSGCASVYRNGQMQVTTAHIDVILENNTWRIADYGMDSTCLPPEWQCKE
jgi:hypothetical protein